MNVFILCTYLLSSFTFLLKLIKLRGKIIFDKEKTNTQKFITPNTHKF